MSTSLICGLASGFAIGLILLLLIALCRIAADRLTVPDGNEDHL